MKKERTLEDVQAEIRARSPERRNHTPITSDERRAQIKKAYRLRKKREQRR